MASASLYAFRDLDLMLAIADRGDGIDSHELADEIGLGDDGARAMSIRLSWMRRYGMVVWDDKRRMWTLSKAGERVTRAKARAAATRQIDSVPDESLVDVMAHVTTRWRLGDPVVAQMLRREFLYGTQGR